MLSSKQGEVLLHRFAEADARVQENLILFNPLSLQIMRMQL